MFHGFSEYNDPFDPTNKSPQPARGNPSNNSSGGFSFAYHVAFTGGNSPRAGRSITTFNDDGYPSTSRSDGHACILITTFSFPAFADLSQSCSNRSARNIMFAV